MWRIVIVTAALLVSALGAQAAPRHPAPRQAASTSACIARQAQAADFLESLRGNPTAQQLAQQMRTGCWPNDRNPARFDTQPH